MRWKRVMLLFTVVLALIPTIHIYAQPQTNPRSIVPKDEKDENLIIEGTTVVLNSGEYFYNTIQVLNGGTLYIQGSAALNATVITVDATSSITADGVADDGLGEGNNGCGGGYRSEGGGGGGGGYGGKGGDGGAARRPGSPVCGGQGGPSYGSPDITEISTGSKGGDGGCRGQSDCYGGRGGLGGGAVSLIAEEISIEGIVSVNGADGGSGSYDDGGGGGGSGGGILIRTSTLHLGPGSRLSAKGGNGENGGTYSSWEGGGGGGGGGGRVKINCHSQATLGGVVYSSSKMVDFMGALTKVMNVSGGEGGMHGGDGDRGESGENGENGTVNVVNLSPSAKSVSHVSASPGDVLTYTINLVNAGTTRAITVTDQIPSNTTYIPGSVNVMPLAGTITDTNGIRWTGTLVEDSIITITFRVTISTDLTDPIAIVNIASINDGIELFERQAVTIVDGYKVYLPITLKNR